MSGQIIGPIGVLPTVSAGGLALDAGGAASNFVTSGTTCVISGFTTVSSNCIVIVLGYANSVAAAATGVSGSTLGSFGTARGTTFGFTGNTTVFWKLATTPLAGETLTVSLGGTTSASAYVAIAISGSTNTGAPFDTNGSCPGIASAAGTDPITLDQTNDFIYAATTLNNNSDTPSTGFTSLYNNNFFLVQYKNPVSGSATINPPSGGGGVIFADALRGS